MKNDRYCMVMVTVPNRDEAGRITKRLLSKKLAACVNEIEDLNSTFLWKGAVDQAEELLLIIKTRTVLLEQLEAEVRAEHSYEVPEIIAIPIFWTHKPYADWIDSETAAN